MEAGAPAGSFTGRVEIPGLAWLGRFVPGQPPSAARPNGTVIALGADQDDRFAGVEVIHTGSCCGGERGKTSPGYPKRLPNAKSLF